MNEFDDFRLFCEQATDSQLREIIRRENEGGKSDPKRQCYAFIAEKVACRRGVDYDF